MARPPPGRDRIEPVLDRSQETPSSAFDIRLGEDDRTAGGRAEPRAGRDRAERSDERPKAADRTERSEPSFGPAGGRDEPAWDDVHFDEPGRAEPRLDDAGRDEPPRASRPRRAAPSDAPRLGAPEPGPDERKARSRREPEIGAADRRGRQADPDVLDVDIEDAEFIDLDEDDPMADSRRSRSRRSKAAPSRKKGRARGRRRSGGSGLGRFIRGSVKWALILMFWGTVALGGTIAYFATQLPSTADWAVPKRPPNIKVLANDGSLIANRGDTGGESVRLDELPPYLSQAVIAIEDRRFYSHFGVDPLGLVRAAYVNFRSGDVVQGGSTVTQQLAKNLFLKPERTLDRKIQEAIMALWLESKYSKAQIMESYLNRVYLGAGTYGVDAASRRYFGKSARDISLKEAAILAGLLKAPSRFAPTSAPEAANARANVVLGAMREAGFITAAQQKEAAAITIKARPEAEGGAGRYVADWVADLVPEVVGALEQDVVVETTIDPHLEAAAGKALSEALDKNGKAFGVSQGALVAIDGTGAVRALVGGRDYQKSQFNRAVEAKRQPGSAFKPFVYLAALEYGLVPESIRVDEPIRIGNWEPKNYGRNYKGPVTLQSALALSINTIAVQLANEIGPEHVVKTAERLGITSPLQPNPSLALGTSEVSLLELTDAYVPFANGGFAATPHVITRVKDVSGKTLYERPGAAASQIIDPLYVGMMNSMMTDTLQRGTGRKAAIPGWQAAGKTGTTNDSKDAWFVGYTSNLTAGVWLGNDDSKPTKRMTGGSLPAQIWQRFMTEAHKGVTVAALPGNYAYRDPDSFQEAPTEFDGQSTVQGGLVDEYGEVVGGGQQAYPAPGRPNAQWQTGPGVERGQGYGDRSYGDGNSGGRDNGGQYGGYADPESAAGWSDGDYQAPPPGARIYREGDPSYGVERGVPMPPAGVGERAGSGTQQARPQRPNLLDRLFGG
ncbi:transglycosylase domain-containing protein [Kaistia adipata]|uniref:transglycosylase domain-containing protein n=1 Tax=Kaistia adipata TaxID=166954 RepID=UPI00041AAF5E|nr:penicillin-binding protein 1A [Kaistia adipata]